MLSERQIKMRRTGIGASEIAAVVGESPWDSAVGVWKSKVYGEDRETNNEMRVGLYLEDSIARWYSDETGLRITRSPTRRHPVHSWMLATPDRIAHPVDAPRRGVECKTVGPKTGHHWGEEPDAVPPYYFLQCQWLMEVTGIPEYDVPVLFLSRRDFKIYTVKRHEELTAELVKQASKFWLEHVMLRIEPTMDHSEAAREYLRAKYPLNVRALQPAPPEAEALAREYDAAKDEIAAAEKKKESARNQLCALIKDAEGIVGEWGRATWKRDASGGCDYKGLAMSLGATEEQIEKFKRPPERKFSCKLKSIK